MKKSPLPSIFLAIALMFAACSPRGPVPAEDSSGALREQSAVSEPEKRPDTSFESVTGHIDFEFSGVLAITRPEKDFSTDMESYYLTGSSDPAIPLLLNGEPVDNRGQAGSFSVFAELESGENEFVFSQGEHKESVIITRTTETESVQTKMLFRMFPETDFVMRAGQEYSLSCTAPAGSTVTASVNGNIIRLSQQAATSLDGVPASYAASYIPEDLEGIEKPGPITYTLEWEETTKEFVSAGSLYWMGKEHELQVRGVNTTATIFSEDSDDSTSIATLTRGTVDRVEETRSGMYKLGMGGWIGTGAVEPLLSSEIIPQTIESARIEEQNESEALIFKGISNRPWRAERKGNALVITLHHATGLKSLDLTDSKLFSSSEMREEDGNTVIMLMISEADRFQGWQVSYENGDTVMSFTLKPEPIKDGLPLEGVCILLDAGHGGTDPGTLCIFGAESNPDEKDITLATALAAKTYLEARGATVVMTRADDEYSDLNVRLDRIQQPDIDLAISLHCNSMSYSNNGSKVSGIETYYFNELSRPLARELQEAVCSATGRADRGIRIANYRIALSSNVPSVLVEMGFMTNPVEYDALTDKQEIYNTAAAIAAGIETLYVPAEADANDPE